MACLKKTMRQNPCQFPAFWLQLLCLQGAKQDGGTAFRHGRHQFSETEQISSTPFRKFFRLTKAFQMAFTMNSTLREIWQRSPILLVFTIFLAPLQASDLPCGKFQCKEKTASCNSPFGLRTVAVTDSSATVDWFSANVPPETMWEVEVFPITNLPSGNPTYLGIAQKPFIIKPLQAGRSYLFRVRAVCGSLRSDWSAASALFQTDFRNGLGCDINIAVPDTSCAAPAEVGILVSSAPGFLLGPDVLLQEVKLIIEHDWLVDLHVRIQSPSGKIVDLLRENGGTANNFGDPSDTTCQRNLTLVNANSCGEKSISQANPPFTGRYLPVGNLNDFNDATSPLGRWKLIFCDDALLNVGSIRFAELVFMPASCSPPSNLRVLATDSTSVMLDWAPGGFCDSTIIEYGAPGFVPGLGTQVQGACPPFRLGGLMGDQEYEVYIFENCGNGIYSNYSCQPVRFRTQCAPPPATIVENFNTSPLCFGFTCANQCDVQSAFWRNAKNDGQDWLVNRGSTFTAFTGPDDDVTGGRNYIYLEANTSIFNNCPAGSEAVLLSNCIEVNTQNTDTCHLSFYYHLYGRDVNSIRLDLTEDGLSWQTLWVQSGNQGNRWQKASVSLRQFNGKTVQFRFVGTRGNGQFGDIGLDEIVFHGSADLGIPGYAYFRDADGDGYGNPEVHFSSCFDPPPSGYVSNDFDCDDTDDSINLSTEEIPCNGLDENCNGLFDDFFLPAPASIDTSICSGQNLVLSSPAAFGGEVFWYDSLDNLLTIGDRLDLGRLVNLSSKPVHMTFSVREISGLCFAPDKATVRIAIHPQPQISSFEKPVICSGERVDLTTFSIIDSNGANGTLTFHTAFPTNEANQVSTNYLVSQSQVLIVRNTASGACQDTAILEIRALPTPVAQITPDASDLTLCRGTAIFLSGNATGGTAPRTIAWSTLETSPIIRVQAGATPGEIKSIVLTATDTNNCQSRDTLRLHTVSSVDTVLTTVSDVTFCNGDDGKISITAVDGVGPYTFRWSGPRAGSATQIASTFEIRNLTAGTYTITVEDNSPEKCQFVRSFLTVNGPTARVALDSIRPVSCHAAQDGAIFLSSSGNNPTFMWSNGQTTEDISGLAAGLYSVIVTADNCAFQLSNLEIKQPENLRILAKATETTCAGVADGSIATQIFGGTAPYRFRWSNGRSDAHPANLPKGAYQVTVSDANGCTATLAGIEIVEPLPLGFQASIQPVLCPGGADGSASIVVRGGRLPYRYQWSNGAETFLANLLPAGTYRATVTDAAGCTLSTTALVVPEPAPFTVQLDSMLNASCPGKSDGGIYLSVNGGTSPITFNWNTGATTRNLRDLPKGAYALTLTDAHGCKFATDTFEVEAPNLLDVLINLSPPFCEGRSDGRITLDIRWGGTPPFDFLWSNGATTQNLTNLPTGTYGVTVLDANQCLAVYDNLKLTALQVMTDTNMLVIPPTCARDSNGSIFANIVGGVAPLRYQWNNGSIDAIARQLAAGAYRLTVTDNRGCQLVTDTIKILAPVPLSFSLLASDSIYCAGERTGSLAVEASGGVPPYQYLWNNGLFIGSTLDSLPAGNYQLEVLDSRNCSRKSEVFQISEPAALEVQYFVKTRKNCVQEVGQDTVFTAVKGGVAPYKYLWSNRDTNQILAGVSPDEYALTVTDANGCQVEVSDIKVPRNSGEFKLAGSSKSDISCFGRSDGSIRVTLGGGVAPYQYLWSDGAGENGGRETSTTIMARNLEKGFYRLTVVDANGCKLVSSMFEIVEPDELSLFVQPELTQNVSCFGGRDGRIALNVRGGTPPLAFEWYNRQNELVSNSQNPFGLPANAYKVVVADAAQCRDTLFGQVIAQPDSFQIFRVRTTGVSCFENQDGSISPEVKGGTMPYYFTWSNGSQERVLASAPPGQYALTVVDAKSCVLKGQYAIAGPSDTLRIRSLTTLPPLCHGQSTGEIRFQVAGGSQPYTYILNNTPLLSPSIKNLPAGSYQLVVYDANFCKDSTSIELSEPPQFDLTFTTRPVTPAVGNDGSATANASGGTPPYQYFWSTGDTTAMLQNMRPGRYFLTVVDKNGCSVSGFVEVKIFSATDEISPFGKFFLYPNPFDSKLTVHFGEALDAGQLRCSVLSLTGQSFATFDSAHFLSEKMELDLSHLPEGTYLVKLECEVGTYIRRVVKMAP
jgi:hypothetical protein